MIRSRYLTGNRETGVVVGMPAGGSPRGLASPRIAPSQFQGAAALPRDSRQMPDPDPPDNRTIVAQCLEIRQFAPGRPRQSNYPDAMPRQTRLEYSGALYHVTARGVRQDAIFMDDRDRKDMLAFISRVLTSGGARAFAYCLMGNHYHLVIQTLQPNLSVLKHRINSTYSQAFNRRHSRCGHVLEGRFHAVLVDRENYLLEVCRYVDLNPVRAGLVESASEWKWSSYRAHVGSAPPLNWLATAELLGVLTGHSSRNDSEVRARQQRYAEWVAAGHHARLWRDLHRQGQFLGDDAFVARVMNDA